MNISKLAFPVIFRQLRFFRDFFVPFRISAPWSPRVGWTGPCVNAVAVSVILRKRIFCFRTGSTWREGLYYKFMWIFLITIKTAQSRILPVLFYVLLLCCYESIDFTSWPGKLARPMYTFYPKLHLSPNEMIDTAWKQSPSLLLSKDLATHAW